MLQKPLEQVTRSTIKRRDYVQLPNALWRTKTKVTMTETSICKRHLKDTEACVGRQVQKIAWIIVLKGIKLFRNLSKICLSDSKQSLNESNSQKNIARSQLPNCSAGKKTLKMIFLQLLAFILAVAGSASGNPEVFTIKVRKITTVLHVKVTAWFDSGRLWQPVYHQDSLKKTSLLHWLSGYSWAKFSKSIQKLRFLCLKISVFVK